MHGLCVCVRARVRDKYCIMHPGKRRHVIHGHSVNAIPGMHIDHVLRNDVSGMKSAFYQRERERERERDRERERREREREREERERERERERETSPPV